MLECCLILAPWAIASLVGAWETHAVRFQRLQPLWLVFLLDLRPLGLLLLLVVLLLLLSCGRAGQGMKLLQREA